jgi:predicted DNA binding protein
MTIRAELHLSSPSLPLVGIAKSLQPDQITCVHGLWLQPGLQMFVIEIDSSEIVSAEELSALDEIVEATTLGEASGKVVYKLTVQLEASISEAFDASPDGALMDPITVTPEGWFEEKLFENYTALTAFQTNCDTVGLAVEIVSITYDTSPSDDSAPYGLTDRQYEALELALSRGYYERPRRITAEELAEELDISQPSMSDLLRRGERQLLSATLTPQTRLAPPPT